MRSTTFGSRALPVALAAPLLLLVLQLSACVGETPTAPTVHQVEFAARFNVNLDEMVERPSGIWYRDDVEGEGIQADIGHDVTLVYDGFLADGTHFESSPSGEPFEFRLGQGGIISGFQEGVIGMRAGGQRLVLVPPYLAFGEHGSSDGRVPPDTWMVFELNVLLVEGDVF